MARRCFFVEVPGATYYEPQEKWMTRCAERWSSASGRQYFPSKRRAIRKAEYLAAEFGEASAGYRVHDKQGNVIADQLYTITCDQPSRDRDIAE